MTKRILLKPVPSQGLEALLIINKLAPRRKTNRAVSVQRKGTTFISSLPLRLFIRNLLTSEMSRQGFRGTIKIPLRSFYELRSEERN